MTNLLQSDGRYYDVNFLEYSPSSVDGSALPSSFILSKALELLNFPDWVKARINETRLLVGINRTLWGLRNQGGVYSLEFYFFYPKKYPRHHISYLADHFEKVSSSSFASSLISHEVYLISYNLDNEMIDEINIYKPVIGDGDELLVVGDTGFSFSKNFPVFNSFSIRSGSVECNLANTYYTYLSVEEFNAVLKRVCFLSSEMFPNEDSLLAIEFVGFPYIYQDGVMIHPSAVTKKSGAIGLYFVGLNIDGFIEFLKVHCYDGCFVDAIEAYKDNLSHMRYDIGIDFYLADGFFRIKKTAFWGTF